MPERVLGVGRLRQAGDLLARGVRRRRPRSRPAGRISIGCPAQAVPAGLRLRGRWRRLGAHHAGRPGGVRAPATGAADAARRLRPGHLGASCSAADCRRRCCWRRSARSASCTGRPTSRSPPPLPNMVCRTSSRTRRRASMEDCAAVMGDAPRWFQLYWSTSDELVASLVGRAEAAGCDGHRGHPGHHDAGLAAAGSGSGLPAVRARRRDRPVHQRSGVPAAGRGGASIGPTAATPRLRADPCAGQVAGPDVGAMRRAGRSPIWPAPGPPCRPSWRPIRGPR